MGITAENPEPVISLGRLAPPHAKIRWRRRRTTRAVASVFAGPPGTGSPRDTAADGRVSAALNEERKRLARDLHDGLAQDLAFIAVCAQGLEPDLGAQHPLVIAARRALGASRGLMADLAARSAPSTEAALALVADELGGRFGVRVEVRSAPAMALTGRADLGPSEREEVVMIAREAIVNAITHGHAQRVDVTLDLEGKRPLLLVTDDGGGVTSGTPKGGFGLPTMRARAESLGGQLVMRRGIGGGTELEVRLVPQAQAVVSEPARAMVASSSAPSSSPIAARSSR